MKHQRSPGYSWRARLQAVCRVVGVDGSAAPMSRARRSCLSAGPLALLGIVLVCTGHGCGVPEVESSAAAPAGDGEGAVGVADSFDLPALESDQLELHGQWRGKPFWLRLAPHSDQFGGRILKVVYTPHDAAGIAALDAHPWLLVDNHLRLLAWNERSNLTAARWLAAADDTAQAVAGEVQTKTTAHYEVVREVERRVGDDVFPDQDQVRVASPLAWPEAMVPALLSLAWRADGDGQVPVVQLFTKQPTGVADLKWSGSTLRCGDQQWTVRADEAGMLHQIVAADGAIVLSVDGREQPLAPEAAHRREQQFMETLLAD